MPDASPTKWHRAHVTWFFEQFLLGPNDADYRVFDQRFPFLFNSYYVAAGPRHARPRRGLITRPNNEEVTAYRAHVDAAVERLIATIADENATEFFSVLEIGLQHEQQHQELLVTDLLHAFAQNPTDPVYDADWRPPNSAPGAHGYAQVPAGIHAIGHDGDGFGFDNEGPRHQVLLQPVRMARGLPTNAEWLEFIADGGYETPALWLADGWNARERLKAHHFGPPA
jgi:ergothioneine biosynthesis protein EgtB